MKTKKLVKNALNNPELYSSEELTYFQIWLKHKKESKEKKKQLRRLELEKLFLQ